MPPSDTVPAFSTSAPGPDTNGPMPAPAAPSAYPTGPAPAAPSSPDPNIVKAMAVGAPFLLFLSIAIPEGGGFTFRSTPAWSALALVCALAVTWAILSMPSTPTTRWAGVIGAGGVAVYWLLIVLPVIAKNTSLLATLGTAATLGAMWLSHERP
jgi:hypothetical protein